ncbi:hypothetical protein SMALA_2187 [Streptomyces malaysiensis subsp. malaysiensis]|nr:hypothetical protein SMALA_2187 [Streptomyces malaysiensis]
MSGADELSIGYLLKLAAGLRTDVAVILGQQTPRHDTRRAAGPVAHVHPSGFGQAWSRILMVRPSTGDARRNSWDGARAASLLAATVGAPFGARVEFRTPDTSRGGARGVKPTSKSLGLGPPVRNSPGPAPSSTEPVPVASVTRPGRRRAAGPAPRLPGP